MDYSKSVDWRTLWRDCSVTRQGVADFVRILKMAKPEWSNRKIVTAIKVIDPKAPIVYRPKDKMIGIR